MAEKETKSVETKVEQVNVDLNDIFNAAPGGDSITLPEETATKPSLFSRKKEVDTSFLYEAKKEETDAQRRGREAGEAAAKSITKRVESDIAERNVAYQKPFKRKGVELPFIKITG